jgi:hypothetical protein
VSFSSPSRHHTHTTITSGIKTVEWEKGRERGVGGQGIGDLNVRGRREGEGEGKRLF